MKFEIVPILLLVSSLTACVSIPDTETILKNMYNVPSSGTSQFDGTKYIRLSNMRCNSIMFELYQDTHKSKKGIVLLKAGSDTITNIGEGESLLIKLDGKTYSFKSNDALTEHETILVEHGVSMPFSHKTYVVPETFVRAVASSKVFLAKMYLLNNSFIEGKCSIITLQEAREQSKEVSKNLDLEITQEHVDTSNKVAAINGFREFVKMMDSTSW